jgi:4-hydroxybenzoate polyprenyltransferase/phosphoserine phosphatase
MALSSAEPSAVRSDAREFPVLFVDLDGSLLQTDAFIESFFQTVKSHPTVLFRAPLWLLRGRATCKSRLAQMAPDRKAPWPYRPEVLDLQQKLKDDGCRLVLATASHRKIADQVAKDLGTFDAVLATDEEQNLKGRNKLRAIEAYCKQHGFQQFAYLGDSRADLAIWEHAAKIFAVAPSAGLKKRISGLGPPVEWVSTPPTQRGKNLFRALRPHQWAKNLLIFLPTILAHQLAPSYLIRALFGFIAFCVCASAVYLVNDFLDLDVDRRHPTKRNRPLASGKLPLSTAVLAVPWLILIGFAFASGAAYWRFSLVLLVYLISSGLYCFWLKREPVVDVFMLSGFYILRIQAGGDAAGVPVSEWLLEFSLFFFLSLAFAKRFVELNDLALTSDKQDTGRGYRAVDISIVGTLGAASGYIAALVFALYLNSPQVATLYTRPKILWLLCPILLFWITRLWLLARRNELHDDPVVFALKDRVSLFLGILCAAVVAAAWLLGARAL